jgi:threonine/homoserine/homoserine lactone efflux protein
LNPPHPAGAAPRHRHSPKPAAQQAERAKTADHHPGVESRRLACLAAAALPGPSTALFLHRTVRDGRAAGLAAVAGNEIGVFCWALAAGAGLTGLLRANRLHVVGAVVLVYLGVSAWRSARRQDDDAEFGAAFARRLPSGRTPAAAFRASLVTIAANPKVAVFAFSFFPQFLPRHGPVFGTTVALASVQLVLDTTYCVGVVLLASRARRWLSRAAIRRRLERVLGATLVALGIDLAAASR